MGKGAGESLGLAGQLGGALGVASPLLGMGLSIAGAISAGKEKRDAKNALDNYERQQLTNVADGLQVSTLGSDLQREEQARLASGQIGALQESGTRGLVGGLGRVEAGNQRVMQQTGADLDMQQKQIDQMRAEDQARIRGMQENREIGDISALSSQYQSGKQDQNMAYGNIVQGVGMLGGAVGQLGKQAGAGAGTGGFSTSGQGMSFANKAYQTPADQQLNVNYNSLNYGSQNASFVQGGQRMFKQPNWYVTPQG